MKYTIEHLAETAKKYNSKNEFRKNATAEYSASYRYNKKNPGFIDEICSHMKTEKELRSKYIKNTKEVLLKEAKKYNTRNEFRTKNSKMYKALLKLDKKEKGLMDKACSHMKTYSDIRKTPLKVFRQKALECETKTEFRNKYPSLYKRALEISRTTKRKNFMKDICSHMKDLVIERELNYTKNIFVPKLRKVLRKRNIKFNIHQEYRISNDSRIDILVEIKNKSGSIFIPIEVKHDYSEWTKTHIKEQVQKYNRYFKTMNNTTKTYLISPNGKYGEKAEKFISKIEKALDKKEKLEKPVYVANKTAYKN